VSKKVDGLQKKIDKKNKKIDSFGDLLDSIESLEDKRKHLWKEIYENALNDRENASILFMDLMKQSQGNSTNHTTFGPIMAKYLERMSKSNDQILRLAEIIDKAESKESEINPDDIFNEIGS
jgi:septal ring factor EnvC (AmiA/AmiB activator)